MSRTRKTDPFEVQAGIKKQKPGEYWWQGERDMIDEKDLDKRTEFFEERKRVDTALFTKKVKFEREAIGRRKAESKRHKKHVRGVSRKISASANLDEDNLDKLESEFADANGYDLLYDMDM